ncbi:MAG TPA: hypothetical protein VJB34_07235, partial [Bdellovibrionota bacterium]|nr:hypothetical protein [Bdellovibrionota bacterium]
MCKLYIRFLGIFFVFATSLSAQVLLVDGDRGFNYEKDYEYALQMAGISYTHWDIAKKGEPDL